MAAKARPLEVMRSPVVSPPGKGPPAAAYDDIRGYIFDSIGLWSDSIERKRMPDMRPTSEIWH